MAKLTAGQRKAMPKSQFGIPSKRGFPVNDKVRAQKALQFIGDAPPTDRPRIRALANAKLGKTGKPKGK